jgi:hypothetical protein
MGRSTESDVVQNVAIVGNVKEISSMFEQDEMQVLHGWQFVRWDNDPMMGKKSRLYADRATKDGKTIYLVNTDEYANVCEYDYAVFSDDKNAVEEFLKDFNIQATIEDSDSICQTM